MIVEVLNNMNKRARNSQPFAGDNDNMCKNTFDMAFECSDVNTLSFGCLNDNAPYSTLTFWNANTRYFFSNGSIELEEDVEYYIYAFGSLEMPEDVESNYIEVRSALLTNARTNRMFEKGEVSNTDFATVAFVGTISKINYSDEANKPYRTVTTWLGQSKNAATSFNGNEIKDNLGVFELSFDNEETSFKLGKTEESDGVFLEYNSDDTLKMQKAKVQSNGVSSRIGCWRGDFQIGTTYNDGDIVRAPIDNENYAAYRCIADNTLQMDAPTNDDENWVALTPTKVSVGTHKSVLLYYESENTWSQTEKTFISGTSKIYVDGLRYFLNIDYVETPDCMGVSFYENTAFAENSRVILEAIFTQNS